MHDTCLEDGAFEAHGFALVVLVVTIAATACGSSASGNSSTSGKTIQVSEEDWSFAVNGTELTHGHANASVLSGTVTFDITNQGSVAHQLWCPVPGHKELGIAGSLTAS